MAERDAVLFANDVFYRAFADGDVSAMDALWSSEAPVSCIHPGWGAILDREEIIASWSAILSDDNAPDIRCQDADAQIYGDVAVVICFETMGDGSLIATNVFCREGRIWKMVHHQAGPTSALPDPLADDIRRPLH